MKKKSVVKESGSKESWKNVSANGAVVEYKHSLVCPHCTGGLIQVSGLYKRCEFCFGTALNN